MHRTEHSGSQEFGPLTPPSGKREDKDDTEIEIDKEEKRGVEGVRGKQRKNRERER